MASSYEIFDYVEGCGWARAMTIPLLIKGSGRMAMASTSVSICWIGSECVQSSIPTAKLRTTNCSRGHPINGVLAQNRCNHFRGCDATDRTTDATAALMRFLVSHNDITVSSCVGLIGKHGPTTVQTCLWFSTPVMCGRCQPQMPFAAANSGMTCMATGSQ